ncbi:MAG: hypothetical protein R3305_10275 [Gammaproteobacteria bacterium]|nr:hypothetical protein [Gammaproteobacteria bacterium]
MSLYKYPTALAASALLATTAAAQTVAERPDLADENRPWLLMLAGLRDDDSFETALASVHVGATDATWLSFTAGKSRAPSAEQDVVADILEFGIEHDFGPVGLSLSAERWGDDNNLEASDWHGGLFFGDERYRVEFVYESRDIDIYFSGAGAPILTDLRKVRVDADGVGINWRFRINPVWQGYGAWMNYDYPRGVRLLPRAERLDLLNASTVTLAYSFIDEYKTIGFEREFGLKLFSFNYSQDKSTFGGDPLDSVGASMLWPVAPRVDFEFSLGRSDSGSFGSTYFGGVTLLIYGGS